MFGVPFFVCNMSYAGVQRGVKKPLTVHFVPLVQGYCFATLSPRM